MNHDELNALHEILDYMWKDEKRNYEETYGIDLGEDLTKVNENNNHIFVEMCTLGNYAQVHQFTLENAKEGE